MRLGLWRQYCNIISTPSAAQNSDTNTAAEEANNTDTAVEVPNAPTTAEAAEDILRDLESFYDEVMGRRPLRFLREIDGDTFISMKFLHRPIYKAFLDSTQDSAAYAEQKKALTRNGGMGTTVILSWGDGFGTASAFHHDNHYDQHYSVLFVVGRTALVYIKSGLNRAFKLQPGFVLYFQASKLEHRLIWDPEDPKGEDDFHCAFTGYTCAAAAAVAGLQ